MRLGRIGSGLHRAREGIARVLESAKLGEDEPDAIPGRRVVRLALENAAVGFERELKAFSLAEQQCQIQTRFAERGLHLERFPERRDRAFGVAAMIERDAEIVVRQGVARLGRHGATITVPRLGKETVLMQRHAALVPQLRADRRIREEFVVKGNGRLRLSTQQVNFRHGLQHQRTVLAPIERLRVLAERLAEITLLPEGEPEVELRELAFGLYLHRGHPRRRARRRGLHGFSAEPAALFDREVRLRT